MKRAIRARATADLKARGHARLLAAALADAATAATMMNRLNQIYNVDVSTQTLLVHTLTDQVGGRVLVAALGESQPGEEAVLFNQVPDGNDGQQLPPETVFGELTAADVGAPVPVQEKSAVSRRLVNEDTVAAATPGIS